MAVAHSPIISGSFSALRTSKTDRLMIYVQSLIYPAFFS